MTLESISHNILQSAIDCVVTPVDDDYELPEPHHHEWVLMDDDTWELVPFYS